MKYDDRHAINGSNGAASAVFSRDIPAAAPAQPSPAPEKPRRRRVLPLAIGAVLLVAAGWGVREWVNGRFVETTDDAFVGADISTVASKVPGFVTKVLVTDNQTVRAGDLLAVIDDRDYRAALAHAEATVEQQEAALANLEASAALQQALIDEARAHTDSTAAEKQRAGADQTRSRSLVQRRVISEQDFEQFQATARKAEADDTSARAALTAAERQLAVIETQKRQTRATLAQAHADRDLAQINLGYTEIRSPIDGVVGSRHVRLGDYATTGAQLMSIVPSNGLYVDANFKESQIARMRPGQRVTIEADVLRGVRFTGTLDSLAPATGAEFSLLPPENATGNFTKIVQRVPIRLHLDGDASRLGRLRPGLSVIARVDCR